ncbi:TetR/AcrR family transcriptional regulator [Sphingomonas sp. GM_Shp_2]|uniref:TetR/AcrR family transcriptional regulator n=1 Tax=Sphingomonas sp. GM_Shp_2 TaxID=2937380 RepID=UPI002269DE6F
MSDDMPSRRLGRPNAAEVAVIDQQIRDAAMASFVKVGFAAAQMESIAAAAGVSKAALYRRYPNKRALLVDIIDIAAQRSFVKPSTEVSGGNPLAQLKSIMQFYRESRRDQRQVEILRLLASCGGDTELFGDMLNAKRASYVEPVDKLIKEAISAGYIRPFPIVFLRETMFDLLVNGVTSQLLFGITPDDDTNFFELRWKLMIGMIEVVDSQ